MSISKKERDATLRAFQEKVLAKVNKNYNLGDVEIYKLEKEIRAAIDEHTDFNISEDSEWGFSILVLVLLVEIKRKLIGGGSLDKLEELLKI